MNTVYLIAAVLYVAASVLTVRAFGGIVRRPPAMKMVCLLVGAAMCVFIPVLIIRIVTQAHVHPVV